MPAPHDDGSLPDFGLASRTDVGPAHIGLILFIGALAAWFKGEQSSTADWVGFGAFLAGCGLWALDPPPELRVRKEGAALCFLGAAAIGYGWWYKRLPLSITGGCLIAVALWSLWRHVFRR